MKPLLLDIDKFLEDDNFTQETKDQWDNYPYFTKLSELKKELKKFLSLPTISFEYANIDGIYKRIEQYIIQIQRLRLVIQPHFKLVIQEHTESRMYILVRADWVDDLGEKKRMVAKVIRRLEVGQRKDTISVKEARSEILPVLREKYKKSERLFGIFV